MFNFGNGIAKVLKEFKNKQKRVTLYVYIVFYIVFILCSPRLIYSKKSRYPSLSKSFSRNTESIISSSTSSVQLVSFSCSEPMASFAKINFNVWTRNAMIFRRNRSRNSEDKMTKGKKMRSSLYEGDGNRLRKGINKKFTAETQRSCKSFFARSELF